MPKVSVVIPVYNVRKYIVRCAETLFCQTLDDMQFIFVDDASTDNSIELLEQTLERFPQRKSQTVILHHPKNLGLPSARATGLPHVKAPYVALCDSDDYVDPTMFSKLYENAIQNNSDLVICGRQYHYPDGSEKQSFDKPNLEESLILNFLHGRLNPAAWGRLTKTDIFRRVQFPTANCGEDVVQFVQLITYAKRVSFINEALYHYNQNRPLSILNERRLEMIEQKMQQYIENYTLMHDFIVAHHQVKEKDFALRKAIARKIYLPQIGRWHIWKRYVQTFPELNNCSFLFNRMFSMHDKMVHHEKAFRDNARLLSLCSDLAIFLDFLHKKTGSKSVSSMDQPRMKTENLLVCDLFG